MSVTHDEEVSPAMGQAVMVEEWRDENGIPLREGVLIDCGYASSGDRDRSDWRWWIVQVEGQFYIGLPGLEVSAHIAPGVRSDRATLDAAILGMLEEHGI